MSVRNISSTPSRNLNITLGSRNLVDSSYVTEETIVDDWVRNASWPACEANTGDNKIVGLYAVFPGDGSGNGSNFFAATISGDYTINYGDGTTANYNSSSIVYYEFNYNNSALDGTNAPVTLNATDDKIERTNHG
jgi:hypothetical protein